MGKSFETSCGGKGANQAVAAANLGMVPASMVCRVPDDVFGGALLHNFRMSNKSKTLGGCPRTALTLLHATAGVHFDQDSTVLASKEQSTGVAAITVDTKTGDNMIVVTPGTNFLLSASAVRDSLQKLAEKSKPAVVLVQLEIVLQAALEALKVGKQLGAITILNPAPAPEDFTLEEFIHGSIF